MPALRSITTIKLRKKCGEQMTREEAIKDLKILKEDYWDDDGYGHETKQYGDTMLALDMAINALEQEPKWIPVSERLPKTQGVYNVTRLIDEAYITDSCFYDGNTWYDDTRINHGRKYLHDVVAWMPLQEPYKESEE